MKQNQSYARLNGGGWFTYSAHVPMDGGDTLEFKTSAPGYLDSATASFENA